MNKRFIAVFNGTILGLVATVILLLVPIAGVRKNVVQLVIDWQELVLYISCMTAGALAGARLALLQAAGKPKSVQQLHIQESIELACPKPSNGNSADMEPQIEESLAVGPRKKRNWWTRGGRERTKILAIFLYLTLYVSCAALCQKLSLGSLRTGELEGELIRGSGLALCLAGLYMAVRSLFVSAGELRIASDSGANQEAASVSEIAGRPVAATAGSGAPEAPGGSCAAEGSAVVVIASDSSPAKKEEPHVPPTRLSFLKNHPICAGWLLVLTGLPLVFLAWFPLLAIPGVFVAMNWLFARRQDARGAS